MSFTEGLVESINAFFKSISFTFKHFKFFFVFPIILFLILFYVIYVLGNSVYHYVINELYSYFGTQHSDWFYSVLSFLLKGILFVLFKILFFLVFYFFSGYLILIILSPILSYLSERTEKILNSKEYSFKLDIWIRQIVRSLLMSLRNMGLQLLLILMVFILSFFPIIGWLISPLSVILILVINSYFLGFSFMDYSFERKGLSISQSISVVRKNKGLAIGLGFIFYLSYLVPIIGNFIAPFMAIFIVVAATFSVEKILE